MSKSKIFLSSCLFFIFGIAVVSYCQFKIFENDLIWFSLAVSSLAVLILFWQKKFVRISVLCGLFLFLGIWRYSFSLPTDSLDKIWHYNNQQTTFIGVIVDEPDIRKSNQKLTIEVNKLNLQNQLESFYNVSDKVLVTTNLYPKYNYGDELKISCELKTPEKFNGFAYDRYLARYDIYSVCYYPKISKLNSSQGNWLYEKIFYFKHKLGEAIDSNLPEPESSLIKAMILGDKSGLSDKLRNNFSQAGLSHIVAISGMHISILAALVMGMFLVIGLARRKAAWFAGLFLIFYITLIGLPASAMRAGLMGFLVLWALNLGRLNKISNTLVLTASILLLFNPKLLRDDIGFQLSFLAVIGIVYVYSILDNWLEKIKIPKLKGIRDIFGITLAAQVFTLPIIAYNFSTVSLIAPLANLLVLWTLPFLMISALGAIGLSFVIPSLSLPFFLPAYLLAKYIILVADWSVKIPYAYLEIDYLWLGWVLIYYAVVVWGVVKLRN